ncbi:uracil-DNA glycosylase [Helicobacter suis]|uniref:Uracil-DNA glycosylase n=1 Tax=Helicobacter suis TaxID=104628 RepID=A0A6J4CZK1_9HELI|nr:uracil-DNA glycosylase [Helicobacter suis]BCD70926.1 Uracil-DNA glycosylase Ung [Helicobacter suis]
MLFHILERLRKSAWFALLEPLSQSAFFSTLNQNYMQSLKEAHKKNTRVFPLFTQIFRAFEDTPLEKLHTILLGQDPYHGTFMHQNQEYPLACGLSFSVPKNAPIPQSLQNIYKELSANLQIKPSCGDLAPWAKQGVLLLNAILSVEKNRAKSHAGLGWEYFTDGVLNQISQLERPLVFIFLGKVAQEKIKLLKPNPKHLIITAPHPSPLAQLRNSNFLGSRIFNQAEDFLKEQGVLMDWFLPCH